MYLCLSLAAPVADQVVVAASCAAHVSVAVHLLLLPCRLPTVLLLLIACFFLLSMPQMLLFMLVLVCGRCFYGRCFRSCWCVLAVTASSAGNIRNAALAGVAFSVVVAAAADATVAGDTSACFVFLRSSREMGERARC